MSADPILYCLSKITDFRQFERLCSDLMAGSGYRGIDPIGGTGDRGRDALHRCELSGAITLFAYTVRTDWRAKLRADCERIKEERHELTRLVFVCTSTLGGNEKDQAKALASGFGWPLEIFDVERLRTLLAGELRHLIGRHPSIFPPSFFPTKTDSVVNWGWPMPWDFSGYLDEKRRGFVGRAWLFDIVRTWYDGRNGPQAMLVYADFGIGKSAFMAELAAGAAGIPIAAHHFCHHDTIETLNPTTFVRSVAAQLAASLADYRAAVEADSEAMRWLSDATLDPASAFERAVVAPLTTIRAPIVPQILLVDALDEAVEFEAMPGSHRATTIVRLLAARPQRFPNWLKILATSRRRQEVLQPMQQTFRCKAVDGDDIRNLKDIHAYVMERCSYGSLWDVLSRAGKRTSDLADFLSGAKQSGGKFLYAVRVLNDLESGALPMGRLTEFPPGMDGFYLDAFERRFPTDADYEVIRSLVAVLCAQREPLSSAQLTAILSTPQWHIQRLLATLEDFLKVRAKRYAFDHLSLSQWLTEQNDSGFARGGRFAVDRQNADNQIADWARRECAAVRAHQSDYLARHLGWYLSEQERKATFTQLLFDFRWLNARLHAAGINALLSDWDGMVMTPALEALAHALRNGAHVLGHDGNDWSGPDLLASQILGRLNHRAESEICDLCAQATEQIRAKRGLRPLTGSLQSTDALLRTLEGHSNGVRALEVLPDGRLASGSYDGTIKLWNPVSGACDVTLEGDPSWVIMLAVLPDGRLVSGSSDGTIKLWNPTSGVCEATLVGHSSGVTALAVLANGHLASGSNDRTIKLWDPTSGVCEATLEGHSNAVRALTVLPDGRLASGSYDGKTKLWNPVSGTCEATLEGHSGAVGTLAVLADGRLASGWYEGKIKLSNPVDGTCEATLEGHSGVVRALAVLADGRLASGFFDGKIKLWNPISCVCEATLIGHTADVTALAVLADGHLASGSEDQTIKLWHPANGATNTSLERHSKEVMALVALTDGRLASGSNDGKIRLWNPTSGAYETTLEGHWNGVMALTVLADGRLASASSDRTIKLWNLASGVCEASLEGHPSEVVALAVLDDGCLVWGSNDGTIKLWHPVNSDYDVTLEGHTSEVTALTVLADGRLASGTHGGSIRLWSPISRVCEAKLEGHSSEVTALAVLADGRLTSGSHDGTIKLWNPGSGACEATLEGHSSGVTTLAVLADGRLASGSEDKSVRIWDLHGYAGRGAVQFIGDAAVTALATAAYAPVLAVGDTSGRIHFLKIESMPMADDPLKR